MESSKRLSLLVVAMMLTVGMLTLAQQAEAGQAEPTLKKTMDWLNDYLPRETGCTNSGAITMFVTKSSFNLQKQVLVYNMHRLDGDDNKKRDTNILLPLWTMKKIEVRESQGCWKATWISTEKNIRIDYGDEKVKFIDGVNILLFRTKESAIRVEKALRHAAGLAIKPQRKELF